MSTYYIYLSGSGLPHSILCFLDPSICLQISRCYYYFFCCVLLHSVNVPHFPSQFFGWGAFRLFPRSGYDKLAIPPVLLVGVQTGRALLDISMAISQRIRKQPCSRFSNTTFEYIPKCCSIIPQVHAFHYVYNSIVYHSRNQKAIFLKQIPSFSHLHQSLIK